MKKYKWIASVIILSAAVPQWTETLSPGEESSFIDQLTTQQRQKIEQFQTILEQMK